MRYEYITKIEIKFDKKKTFKRKSIKYLQKIIFQESVKLPGQNLRPEIKSDLCAAACKDEKQECDYGRFYSHNSMRKYIKIYY